MVESFFFFLHLLRFFSLAKNQTLVCFLVSTISKSLSFDLLHELKPSMIRTLTVLIVCFNVFFFFVSSQKASPEGKTQRLHSKGEEMLFVSS